MPKRAGQIVGGLWLVLAVTGCYNNPNPGMVDIARSLAPPETTVTDVGENTGSHVIVGDYFAVVEIDDGGLGADGLLDALAVHADGEGWGLIDTGGTAEGYAPDVQPRWPSSYDYRVHRVTLSSRDHSCPGPLEHRPETGVCRART